MIKATEPQLEPTMIEQPEFVLAALLIGGCGLIFLITERLNRISVPLSLCLLAIAANLILFLVFERGSVLASLAAVSLESAAILLGIEWGRRVGKTCDNPRAIHVNRLFRASQILGLVYWGLSVGYLIILPEVATTDLSGFIRVRGAEFAVFAPIIGTQMLLSTIAIVTLLFLDIDAAEVIRLRALSVAAPFLLAGLIVHEDLIPFTLATGLLWFLAGSLRYLYVQGQRGQFMSQFLSPEVAKVVKTQGLNTILKQERRPITAVFCDLRGFTAYARQTDSAAVTEVLAKYYDLVGQVAARHNGTVKDHAGDGVLMLVGAPLPIENHEIHAYQLAVNLRDEVQQLLASISADLGIGLGIATGSVTVGAIKGAGRLEYVAVGSAVNLASRLCDQADNGEILCDSRCQQALAADGVQLRAHSALKLKGFEGAIEVFSAA